MIRKNLVILGANGMVGKVLKKKLIELGYSKNLKTPSSKKVDLRDYNQVLEYFQKVKPKHVFFRRWDDLYR